MDARSVSAMIGIACHVSSRYHRENDITVGWEIRFPTSANPNLLHNAGGADRASGSRRGKVC